MSKYNQNQAPVAYPYPAAQAQPQPPAYLTPPPPLGYPVRDAAQASDSAPAPGKTTSKSTSIGGGGWLPNAIILSYLRLQIRLLLETRDANAIVMSPSRLRVCMPRGSIWKTREIGDRLFFGSSTAGQPSFPCYYHESTKT
ncbi:uncharacterized protein [Coffea arabica]|uniref:Uncharacterized protein n=1 Tax=Coffea arabica TaxID=13443 RepID=A0ABM4UGQ0_COFAR